MEEKKANNSFWKVITIDVDVDNSIKQIDEKLPAHLDIIQSLVVSCNPRTNIEASIAECGELSLSLNNKKEHVLHTITDFTEQLPMELGQTLPLNAKLESNTILGGYYRDFGKMKEEDGQFVPYQVKLLMECTAKI